MKSLIGLIVLILVATAPVDAWSKGSFGGSRSSSSYSHSSSSSYRSTPSRGSGGFFGGNRSGSSSRVGAAPIVRNSSYLSGGYAISRTTAVHNSYYGGGYDRGYGGYGAGYYGGPSWIDYYILWRIFSPPTQQVVVGQADVTPGPIQIDGSGQAVVQTEQPSSHWFLWGCFIILLGGLALWFLSLSLSLD